MKPRMGLPAKLRKSHRLTSNQRDSDTYTHVGASAFCTACGNEFKLTAKDKPKWFNATHALEIACPNCGNTVFASAMRKPEPAEEKRKEPAASKPAVTAQNLDKGDQSFIGAKGYCERCGKEFVLGAQNRPIKKIVAPETSVIFVVNCPAGCGNQAEAKRLV